MFLGVDLGTSSLKAALFSAEGECVRRWRIGAPPPRVAGNQVELDPLAWWTALQQVLTEAPDATALSIGGLTNTHVLVDVDGNPLMPAISWADTRTSDLDTGEPTISVAGRLLWLEQFAPDLLAQASSVLFAKDFLVRRLTGECVGDVISWRRWVAGDRWGEDFPARFRHLLPRLVEPGAALGEATAGCLGPGAGPLVVAGVPDALAAAMGAGSVAQGDAWVIAGSSETAGLWVDTASPVSLPVRFRMWGTDTVVLASSVGGVTHGWAERMWPAAEAIGVRADAVLDRPAGRPTPLFLPHIFGERAPEWNPEARGALLGLGGESDAADVWAAVTESIAFVQRQLLAKLQIAGDPLERVVMAGGPAQGRSRGQLLADVLGEAIFVAQDVETGVRGSAMLALQAEQGLSSAEAVAVLAPDLAVVEPRPVHSDVLQGRYREFLRLTALLT